MQEPLKPMPSRQMHKYVWGFVGVFFLIAASYPIAFWRVSQDQKFAGFHVKSLTDEGKLNLPSNAAVAVQTPASSNSASVAVQPANPAETIASSSNTNSLAQPENIVDSDRYTAIANPTIASSVNQVAVNPTDPVQLSDLNQKVYDLIAKNWQLGRRFEQSLVYRVSATSEGAIASFQPINQSASNLVQQTPLPKLLPSSASTNTPVADFRVVFTSLGILEVSPWDGYGK